MTTPRFATRIDAHGPAGNTLAVLGVATSYMRQLGVDPSEIKRLRMAVMTADSREAALNSIRAWFPIDE